jgi:hypothetical protein
LLALLCRHEPVLADFIHARAHAGPLDTPDPSPASSAMRGSRAWKTVRTGYPGLGRSRDLRRPGRLSYCLARPLSACGGERLFVFDRNLE